MFVRNGEKLGSVLVDVDPSDVEKRQKRAAKKAAAKAESKPDEEARVAPPAEDLESRTADIASWSLSSQSIPEPKPEPVKEAPVKSSSSGASKSTSKSKGR